MQSTATITSTVVHAFLIYLFFFVFEWGFQGVCLATALMFFTRFMVNVGLVECTSIFTKYDDVKLFSKQSCTDFSAQMKLGFNAMSMGVWGWWAFDIFTLIASYLASEVIAAQTILRSIGLITFMLPVGIASACGTLTGNSVGEGRADKAVRYYRTSMYLSLLLALIQVTLLVTLRPYVVALFTDNVDIAEQMILAWPIVQIFVIFDCTQGVSASVIRGTGQQRIGSYITMSSYWVFGIPIALVAVFALDAGIRGLWIGPTFATFYNTCCYTFLINRIDWQNLIETTKARRLKEKAAAELKAAQKAEEEEQKVKQNMAGEGAGAAQLKQL